MSRIPKMNPAQRVVFTLAIVVLLLPVALWCGFQKARARVRAGRLSIPSANR
jgi:hypothetical protein